MDKIKICGVYKIYFHSKKCYIGSSNHCNNRKRQHLHKLRKNKHHSYLLQRAFNKYGEKAFKFEIIEECEVDNKIKCEDKWLNFYESYNSTKGYNISKNAKNYDTSGISLSDNHKQSISKSLKKFYSINKVKNRPSYQKKIVYEFDCNKKFIKEWGSCTEAEIFYKVSLSLISHYARNKYIFKKLNKYFSYERN